MTYDKRTLTFHTLATEPAKDGLYSVTITTNAVDRTGEVCDPMGMRYANWQKAGMPMGYGHEYRTELPVATGQRLTPTANGWRLAFKFIENDPFASRVKNAWDQGAIRAASVGFVPIAGTPLGRDGYRHDVWDLIEVSLTPVPANPEAVRTLKALGLSTGDDGPVLLLADEDDAEVLVIADARETPEARAFEFDQDDLAAVIRAELAAAITRETRKAVNALRGRID